MLAAFFCGNTGRFHNRCLPSENAVRVDIPSVADTTMTFSKAAWKAEFTVGNQILHSFTFLVKGTANDFKNNCPLDTVFFFYLMVMIRLVYILNVVQQKSTTLAKYKKIFKVKRDVFQLVSLIVSFFFPWCFWGLHVPQLCFRLLNTYTMSEIFPLVRY